MLRKLLRQFLQKDKTVKLLLLFLSLFLIAARFLWLNEFPVGVLHDEVDVTLSAKTYWHFGTDLSGISFPKSLFVTNTWAFLSGLPSFLLAPVYGFIKLTPLTIRLPYVFLSMGIAGLIYFLVNQISKDKKLATISFFVSLINPWLYFYSRQPTEAPFSLFFALLGTLLLFKFKGTKIFYSFLFFVFSFFSYFGAKPVIPVVAVLLVFLHWKYVGTTLKKWYLLYISGIILTAAVYFLTSFYSGGSTLQLRAGQVTFLNLKEYSTVVDEQRRASIEFPGKNILFNKYTAFGRDTISKYLDPFSPDYLFLSGDGMLSLNEHGVLYYADLVFLIAALAFLIKVGDKKYHILGLISLIYLSTGSLGSAISTWPNQFVFRAFLHIPAYIILVSLGIYLAFTLFKNRRLLWMAVGIVSVVYIISFINFLAIFFFRYSVKEQDHHFVADRVLVKYIDFVDKAGEKVTVITNETDRIFYQYAFYTDYFDKADQLKVYKKGEPLIENGELIFTSNCEDFTAERTVIVSTKAKCKNLGDEFIVIQNQKDAGVEYAIYNDEICKNSILDVYRREHRISDYAIEKMNIGTFCNRWIQNGKTN